MSKSNIEKLRLQKIKLFEDNNIEIDSSIFKVKIKFKYIIKNKHETFKQNILNIDKDIVLQYQKFFKELIFKNLKDLKIYNFNVHLNIEHNLTDHKKFIKVKAFVYHKKTLICDIDPLSLRDKISHRFLSNLLKNPALNTFEIGNDINIKNFVETYISKCPDIYINPHFFQNFQISNQSKCVSFLHFSAKNRIPNIFKNSNMYQTVENLMKFMRKNKNILGINGFTIRYDFAHNEYNSFAIKIPSKTQKKIDWFFIHETGTFKNNLEVYASLKKHNFINFNIDGLTENEIFEMCELLNY